MTTQPSTPRDKAERPERNRAVATMFRHDGGYHITANERAAACAYIEQLETEREQLRQRCEELEAETAELTKSEQYWYEMSKSADGKDAEIARLREELADEVERRQIIAAVCDERAQKIALLESRLSNPGQTQYCAECERLGRLLPKFNAGTDVFWIGNDGQAHEGKIVGFQSDDIGRFCLVSIGGRWRMSIPETNCSLSEEEARISWQHSRERGEGE